MVTMCCADSGLRPLWVVVWVCALAMCALAGCSPTAGGGLPPAPRDAGMSGGVDAGMVVMPGVDAGMTMPPPGVDAGPIEFPDGGCEATVPVETEIIGDPPDLLLVVDASSSMITPLGFDFTTTKWSVMDAALESLVNEYQARIRFGLMTFPGSGECGPGAIRSSIAERNAADVIRQLDTHAPSFTSGATPTHLSIDEARSYYGGIEPNPIGRYVLLATDGLPNCGLPRDEEGNTLPTVDETVTAITNLRSDGIDTFVLGFGSFIAGDGAALTRMAEAGGTTRYYPASSPATLSSALESIAAEIIPPSCTLELGTARDPALLRVELDGMVVPRDTSRSRGWDYDAGTNTITFYGSDCERLQSTAAGSVSVDFGCPGPLI